MNIVKRNFGLTKEELRAKALLKAQSFIDKWALDKHDERQEATQFEEGFLNIFGLDYQNAKLEYEVNNKANRTNYVDLFWPGELLIEMKTSGSKKYFNGEADDQVFSYVSNIKISEDIPKVVMVSDFNNIRLFDLRQSIQDGIWNNLRPNPVEFPLTKLTNDGNFSILQYLLGREDLFCKAQPEVSKIAAEELGKLYNLLVEKNYNEEDRILFIMRVMFCLFADNSHIFNDNQFANFILESIDNGNNVSLRLVLLFEILNTPQKERACLSSPWNENKPDSVLKFPYVNGGLFSKAIKTPPITNEEAECYIINNCATMDWSKVSPSIFGALFQSIRTRQERRELGEHYTSEENIEKVINPLFLEELNNEFHEIINENSGNKLTKLMKLQDKLGSLQLLDPACGCGNFLIVAYSHLRDIETRIVKELYSSDVNGIQQVFDASITRKIKLSQLHGIEIDPFPQMIAKTAAWLQDHLANEKLSKLVGEHIPTIPLTDAANIIQGNALQLDWEACFEDMKDKKFDYIFGNPPFNGARTMTKDQKSDMKLVFNNIKGAGDLDYVTAWYWKAAIYMQHHNTCSSAFVSTNSITQGQQVAILWEPLFKIAFINFAYRSFKWINEAKGLAAVYCVIIGFRSINNDFGKKFIWNKKSKKITTNFINPYLFDSKIEFLQNREKPLCDVPAIKIGNKLIDGGYYIFSDEEKDNFIKDEPKSEQFFHKFIGAKEFLYNLDRYLLRVADIEPNTLKTMPKTIELIEKVKEYRLNSSSLPTRKIASTPTQFHVTNISNINYIVIPKLTSHKRDYIPIGIIDKSILSSDLLFILPSSSLYIFAILSSSIHMHWVHYVAGRFGEGYRYSAGIVYNNFPWPVEPKDKSKIENLANNILLIRKNHKESCLADLYDSVLMPYDLQKAHKELDKAILKLYGLKAGATDDEILDKLFNMYREYVKS